VGAPPLLEGFVTADVLDHPRVEEWRRRHPQEWWALNQLRESDETRDRVLAAVLAGRHEDEAIDELVRFAEAMEGNQRAARDGTLAPPPPLGERRPLEVRIKRMTKMRKDDRLFFRVDFATPFGWSGYFDTSAPDVVERVAKHRHRSRPLTVVGEVAAHPYDFLVVLGGRVRIV
jgi:hypothetical protein